jgi:hypothetical protein
MTFRIFLDLFCFFYYYIGQGPTQPTRLTQAEWGWLAAQQAYLNFFLQG